MSIHSPATQPLTLSHVADRSRCYPGEIVTLATRVEVRLATAGYTLMVALPRGLRVQSTLPQATEVIEVWRAAWSLRSDALKPQFRKGPTDPKPVRILNPRQGTIVRWRQEGALPPETCHDYQLKVEIEPFDLLWRYYQDETETNPERRVDDDEQQEQRGAMLPLLCYAQVYNDVEPLSDGVAPITVYAQGRYLHYLPALYEQDGDFIGRFLMLFESFWAPIEQQIEHIYDYFDLNVTPLPFLRWLATWFDLALPEHWAEKRQRQLLAEIVQLYRQRGTPAGLKRHLELVTGGVVHITEYSSHQFRIGRNTRLGAGVAVGRKGQPHTFDVQLTLPWPAHLSMAETNEASKRLKEQTQMIVKKIIEAEKPAHTAYTISIDYADRG